MKRQTLRLSFLASLVFLDLAGLTLAMEGSYWTRFLWEPFLRVFPAIKGVPSLDYYHEALWALLPMCLIVFLYAGLYNDVLVNAYDEFISVCRGVLLCSFLVMAMTFAIHGTEYSRLTIGLWAIYSVILIYPLRELDKMLFRRILLWLAGPERILVIGKGKAMEAIRHVAGSQPFVQTSFLESLPDHDSFRQRLKSHAISEVVLLQGLLSSATILETAKICEEFGIACRVVPDLLEMRRGEIIMDGFCGLPTFAIRSLSLYGANYALKRSFDVALSLILTVLFAIPLLVIAVLIKLDSKGPVFYTQYRMGFHGKKFRLYKFRTMDADADAHIEKLKKLSDRAGPVFKMKNDPRVTSIGQILRKFSLDEVPQIINVIKGDMSLVGPRPQVLWEAAAYDDYAKRRLRIKPGITGLWQVSGRAALSYEEMINLDIFYLENWSLGLDLKILIRTIPAIFAKEGAY